MIVEYYQSWLLNGPTTIEANVTCTSTPGPGHAGVARVGRSLVCGYDAAGADAVKDKTDTTNVGKLLTAELGSGESS